MTSLLANGDAGVNNVTFNGVEGTLTIDQASYQNAINSYYFTRAEAGSEVTVPAGTEIICAAADEYKDAVQVIWLGSYGGYADLDQLIEQQKALINRQTANGDRYIVLGLYYLSLYGGGGYQDAFNQYENAMAQEYGDHFINVRNYLATDGLRDAGITATNTDKSQMSVGNVPDSLRNPSSYTELNAAGYDLVGQLVYDRMMKLGYFDEVLDECGLKDIVK